MSHDARRSAELAWGSRRLGAAGVFQFATFYGWNLRLYFPAAFAVGAAVLTLVLCLLASIMPSVRAAWLPVPAALRNE